MLNDEEIKSWLVDQGKASSDEALEKARIEIRKSQERFSDIDGSTGLPKDWNNQGGFVDPFSLSETGFIENSKNFELEEYRTKNSKKNKIIFSISGLALVAAIAFSIFVVSSNSNKSIAEPVNDPFTNYQVNYTNPLESYNLQKVSKVRDSVISSNSGRIETSTGHSLALKKGILSGVNSPESIHYSKEYKMVGSLEFENSSIPIFYTENIVDNPVFSTSATFEELSKTSTYRSYSMISKFINGDPALFLTIVNNDGSGWFLQLPETFENSDVSSLLQNLIIDA